MKPLLVLHNTDKQFRPFTTDSRLVMMDTEKGAVFGAIDREGKAVNLADPLGGRLIPDAMSSVMAMLAAAPPRQGGGGAPPAAAPSAP